MTGNVISLAVSSMRPSSARREQQQAARDDSPGDRAIAATGKARGASAARSAPAALASIAERSSSARDAARHPSAAAPPLTGAFGLMGEDDPEGAALARVGEALAQA